MIILEQVQIMLFALFAPNAKLFQYSQFFSQIIK